MFPDLPVLQQLAERVSLSELSDLIAFYNSDTSKDSVWPTDDEPLGFVGVTYLDRFRKRLVDADRFSPDEITLIVRHARGYAGGVASADARKRRKEEAEEEDSLAASEGYFQVAAVLDIAPMATSEITPWLQITPKAGDTFDHPRYGKLEFTRAGAAEMVSNFKGRVYQDHIPIDAEHQTKLSGALGFYRELRVRSDGAVEAKIEMTERGQKLRADGGFRYFSPEFFKSWKDPASGQTHNNLLVGGAFTTRPFFKDESLAPLAANESAYTVWTMGGTSVDDRWKKDDDGELELDGDGNPQLTDAAVKADKEAIATVTKTSEEAVTVASVAAVTKFRDEHKLDEDGKPVEEGKGPESKSFSEQYPDQAKEMDALNASNAILRRQAQTQQFTEVVLGRSGAEDGATPWTGETEKHVTHMISLTEKFGDDSDEFQHYVNMNKEHAVQIAKAGLFSEKGSSATGKSSSAEDKALEGAKELMKADSDLTLGDAISQVLSENPELYTESVQDGS